MKKFFHRWIVNSLALFVVAFLLSDRVYLTDPRAALTAALVLGVVNALLRPILIVLTLPLNFFTFGLFTLVINGMMLEMVSSMVRGFSIRGGFGSTMVVALILSAVSWLIGSVLSD